jgi:glycosyltransferase involved in cell wall biosynthesis
MTPVFDMSRLVARAVHPTPTGIDRFELRYADWFRRRFGDRGAFVVTNRAGSIVLGRAQASDIIDAVGASWNSAELSPEQAAQLAKLAAAIDGQGSYAAADDTSRRTGSRGRAFLRRGFDLARASFHTPAIDEPALFHVSHVRLDHACAYSWLGTKRRGVFYVHDLIPLTHPHCVRRNEPWHHLWRMRTVLRHGSLVLCNSPATKASFERLAADLKTLAPPVIVVPPGVEDAFLRQPQAVPVRRPYFVCVGTIEPRKNHAFLLALWRRLAARDGADAPRLVIAGRRGWAASELLAQLDSLEGLRGLVFEAPHLSDAAIARLLAGAAALLAPSLVEGYGMPVAEALALGTPVIASDIAAHRAVAGSAAAFLDSADGAGWLAAVTGHARHPRRLSSIVRSTWTDHFREVDALLAAAPARIRAGGPVANLRYAHGR